MLNYLLADDVFISNHSNYEDKIKHFLKDMKIMCVQYAVCFKIMNGVEEGQDVSLVKKLVYQPESDTYYIFVEGESFARYLMERITWGTWMINGSLKSRDVTHAGGDSWMIEMVFNCEDIISRNNAYKISTISL